MTAIASEPGHRCSYLTLHWSTFCSCRAGGTFGEPLRTRLRLPDPPFMSTTAAALRHLSSVAIPLRSELSCDASQACLPQAVVLHDWVCALHSMTCGPSRLHGPLTGVHATGCQRPPNAEEYVTPTLRRCSSCPYHLCGRCGVFVGRGKWGMPAPCAAANHASRSSSCAARPSLCGCSCRSSHGQRFSGRR